MFQMKKSRKRYTIGLLAGWPVYGSYAADRFVDYIALNECVKRYTMGRKTETK